MTPGTLPRKGGVVLLATAAALAFWAGWGLGLMPRGALMAMLGAGLISAAVLLVLADGPQTFRRLAGTLLGLCPTAALLVVLASAGGLDQAAGNYRLWPLILSLFAALLTLSLLPGTGSRAAFARGGLVLAVGLTLAELLGGAAFADRWVLQSLAHLAIAFTACLVLAAQAHSAVTGPLEGDEARLTSGMTQLLPLLGFAGTVWGIMIALEALPAIFEADTPSTDALQDLLGGLGTAFETTLLGLAAAVTIAVLGLILPDDRS
jgi:hypothetical protein